MLRGLEVFDVALLGLLAAVLGLASKLVLRAVLAGVELPEDFCYKLVVGTLLGGEEGPMKSAPEPLVFILLLLFTA